MKMLGTVLTKKCSKHTKSERHNGSVVKRLGLWGGSNSLLRKVLDKREDLSFPSIKQKRMATRANAVI